MNRLAFFTLGLFCGISALAEGAEDFSLSAAPKYKSSMDQTIDYMFDMGNRMTVDDLYGFSVARTYEVARTGDNAHYVFFQGGWYRGTETVLRSAEESRFHFAQEVVPFYFGYRYERALSENWLATAGLTAGYVHSRDEKKQTSPIQDYYWKYSVTSSTFAAGGMVGVRYRITPRLELLAGYTATIYSALRSQSCEAQIPGKHSAVSGTASLGFTLKF